MPFIPIVEPAWTPSVLSPPDVLLLISLSSSSSLLPSAVKAASHLQTSPYLMGHTGKHEQTGDSASD